MNARRIRATSAGWGTLAALVVAAAACASGDAVDGGGGGSSETGGSDGAGASPSCEGIDLESDPQNCGSCGRTCVLPNGNAACLDGECALGECALGFADCDGDAETGCEVTIDCDEGGACMTSCGSTGGISCADPCSPTCTTPAESCNGVDDDCDGACDQGAIAGCRIGVHRAYDGQKGHLFTTDLAEAQAWGLEVQNFFYLYSGATADLRPFFRCALGNATFYTDSTDCEMTGAPLLTVGFIAPQPASGEPTCGAVPLYRISYAANGWHFYTISAPERDTALANGWADEGIAGYVWTSP